MAQEFNELGDLIKSTTYATVRDATGAVLSTVAQEETIYTFDKTAGNVVVETNKFLSDGSREIISRQTLSLDNGQITAASRTLEYVGREANGDQIKINYQ